MEDTTIKKRRGRPKKGEELPEEERSAQLRYYYRRKEAGDNQYERNKESQKRWRERNKEKIKEQYSKNKESARAAQRRYYRKNRIKLLENARQKYNGYAKKKIDLNNNDT